MSLTIRLEEPRDYFEVESLTREAFWDSTRPGCNEHLLVRKLRKSPAFLPELCFVAELDGKLVGSIVYSKSKVVGEDGAETPTLIFGPLSVLPEYQRKGIGGALLRHSLAQAGRLGHRAVLIYGHPSYYPRFGFQNAAKYGITTREGENGDYFMALELYPGALDNASGRYFFDPVFEDLPEQELLEFEKLFPPKVSHFKTH